MMLILILPVLFCITSPLYADWPADSIIDTEIVAEKNLQVLETAETIVIAGVDGSSNVQVRKFDKASGVFSEKRVLGISLPGVIQSNTFRMVYNPKAGNILVLLEVISDPYSNIYGLLLDANGNKLTDPVSLTGADPLGKYFSPEAAVNTSSESGTYFVAYSNDSDTRDNTYGRFFTAALQPLGNRFEVAADGPCVGIAYIDSTDNYYAAYKQFNNSFLLGRFVTSQGELIGNIPNTIANLYLVSWASLGRKPDISYFPSLDKILAVWRKPVSETPVVIKITGRLISSDPFAANPAEFYISKGVSKQLDPIIIDKGRIVLWTDDRGGTASLDKDIYLQAVGPFGSVLGADFRVVPTAVSQEYATAACIDLAQKTYLVFWNDGGKFYSLIRQLPISTDPGDADGDLAITLTDAILICRVAARIEASVTAQADVNNDKTLGLAEIVFVLQKVAGLRE
jgi:hypothetical protein